MIVIVPFAGSGNSTRVMLVRRRLLQSVTGARRRLTPPPWAGQWGLIAGDSRQIANPLIKTAAKIFLEQTGIELPNTDQAFVRSDVGGADEAKFVLVPMDADDLGALADQVDNAVGAQQVPTSVIGSASVSGAREAEKKLGPTPTPQAGWQAFIIREVFGGTPPGALDTTLPMLVQQIKVQSQLNSDVFKKGIMAACRSQINGL